MVRRSPKRIALILPFIGWLVFFILGPMGIILVLSFSHRTELGQTELGLFEWTAYQTLMDPLYAKVLLTTVLFAAGNTLLTLLMAYPLSYFIYRLQGAARVWMVTLILVPFWTSFLVRILSFIDVLRLRPFGISWLYETPGVLGAMVYNYLLFAVLPIFSAMEKIDYSLVEAASDLGAGRRRIFTQVLWPLTQSGVSVAALFVFVPSLGEFLIPELVGGGRFFLLGSFLQNQFLTARNWPLGAAAIVILVFTTLLVLPVIGLVGLSRAAIRGTRQAGLGAE